MTTQNRPSRRHPPISVPGSLPLLTSTNNPLLKRIRLLSSGSRRAPSDLVLAEGTRVLEEAMASGHTVTAVVVSDAFGRDSREQGLLDNWRNRKIPIYRVQKNLFQALSCLQTSQGAIAIVTIPEPRLPLNLAGNTVVLYACGIQDPGNLGTLIRTAAASGATLVCTSRETVSARNPKAIRSSAGVYFHHPPVEDVSADAFLHFCRDRSIRVYRTDARAGIPYTEADLASPCAVLLGNEGRGMEEAAFAGLPSIRIPMANGIESLNVALAGAVIVFEAARQRSLACGT